MLLGVLISAVCLWYALKDVDLPAMVNVMGRVGLPWVAASIVAGLSGLLVRAVRWRLLLGAIRSVEISSLASATFVGMMANNLLPARLGEVVRAWVLARREELSTSTVFASIMVERLLDALAALTIFGLCLAVLPELSGTSGLIVKRAGIILLIGVAVGMTLLALVLRSRERLLGACDRLAIQRGWTWLCRPLELLRRFVEGLRVFKSPGQIAMVAGLSLIIWMLAIVSFHVLAEGFSLGITPMQTALVFVIVLFGVAAPSAPGFVGTFHGFCVAGLGMVAGVEPTQAAAYATLLHGSQWLAINVVGVICLMANRSFTWAGVLSATRQG